MPEIDHLPGRTLVTEDGREYLFCSGTGYLGIARNPEFAVLLTEGLLRYGTNYSSSRHSNLRLRVFDEAEAYLAAYTGAEAAVTVSSGYLAGQMAVAALRGTGEFAYAPGTHPAAWLADSPDTAPAGTHRDWASRLLQELHSGAEAATVIVSNSLDPLRLEPCDFGWTRELPTHKPLTLLIDDSHGFGITGPDGAGIFSQLQVPANVRVVVVSSMGKALGIPGGVVLSDAAFITRLRSQGFFGASSPIPPAYLWAFLEAQQVYRLARQRLARNVAQFAAGTAGPGLFRALPDFPVFYTPANELCAFLEARDVLISSFSYPTPADACITRVVLNALHTTADVERLTELVREFARQRA
ncbi:aminotransferase class I/II-fold pyridoxal phosphate-dependent enzyme [Hymenobacter sp. BT175]|uniref:aminotransferase class I/II-fold pyridoxal phosphate-dependent enzyme n=1 Tax=Hymenobacter translucens TaxID=2886507 RepID=UPI001D0E5EA1|nr:aminotransferase class I/II-fold pyridoxal phosphate-dependent enzyme [Hymenobacter translucens]MCC2545671.1 aminotransferase class I/II-fold pyridoxal phosphate-dependent enzyme [Hymenobacter translucens]